MYQIYLLRHGETELSHTLRGSTDDALTTLGWQQMKATVDQSLATGNKPWDVIFSSPLQRCRLFAENLAENLELDLMIDPNLQEMHFGDWEAISTAELYEKFPERLAKFWEKPTQFTPPSAETIQNFHQRVMKGLENIHSSMQQHAYKKALIVTHGGIIKLLKCMATEQPLDDILKMSAELGQLNHLIMDDDVSLSLVEQKA